jgi:hypothetical protein
MLNPLHMAQAVRWLRSCLQLGQAERAIYSLWSFNYCGMKWLPSALFSPVLLYPSLGSFLHHQHIALYDVIYTGYIYCYINKGWILTLHHPRTYISKSGDLVAHWIIYIIWAASRQNQSNAFATSMDPDQTQTHYVGFFVTRLIYVLPLTLWICIFKGAIQQYNVTKLFS